MVEVAPLSVMIRRWLPGWVACRGLPAAGEVDSALVATLDLPGRYREYFALDDDAVGLRRLTDRVTSDERPAWLTVPTGRPDLTRALLERGGLEVFGEPETFMSIELRRQTSRRPEAPYRWETTRDGAVLRAVITDGTGQIAAEGMTGLSGVDAVPHAIRTDPAHRRRGLGSVVMTALAEAAIGAGATAGLLIASPAGAHLYTKLGWNTEATVLSARVPIAGLCGVIPFRGKLRRFPGRVRSEVGEPPVERGRRRFDQPDELLAADLDLGRLRGGPELGVAGPFGELVLVLPRP